MTITELLKPRLKCIGTFPGMKREGFEEGMIFEPLVDDSDLPKRYPLLFTLTKTNE